MMEIDTGKCLLRPWRAEDKVQLAAAGNSRAVWRNLTHMFPHPYTEKDAEEWLESIAKAPEGSQYAIVVDGRVIGGVGGVVGQGIFAKTAEFGYWLGQPWWGRGIATSAAMTFSRRFMAEQQLHRLQAYVFSWNPGSANVLEKCGFVREAVLRRSAVKDGQVVDELLYALTDQQLQMLNAPRRIQADSQRDREIVIGAGARMY